MLAQGSAVDRAEAIGAAGWLNWWYFQPISTGSQKSAPQKTVYKSNYKHFYLQSVSPGNKCNRIDFASRKIPRRQRLLCERTRERSWTVFFGDCSCRLQSSACEMGLFAGRLRQVMQADGSGGRIGGARPQFIAIPKVVGGKTSGKANFPTKYFPINAKMEFNLLEWRMCSKNTCTKMGNINSQALYASLGVVQSVWLSLRALLNGNVQLWL